MRLISMIFTILFVLYSQIAVSITNCKTCGSSSGFGKELGTIYPTDPFFHTKNLNLSCTRSNGTSWNNQLSGYVSSEYIYATQNRRNQVILIVGHLTKDKNKIKIKGIKKWLPKNQLDNYHFVTQIDESIDKTFKSKIKGSNRWSEDCHITENNYFVPRVPYEDDKYSIEEKQKGLNRAIQTLKGFQMREFAINKRLTQEGYNVEVKFELADLITDLTIKMAQLGNKPKIIIKEDEASKRLAEQRAKELKEEKKRRIAEEKERKILEARTKQLAEEKRLAELKAKKRADLIAKEVAAEKQKKIEEERALRKAEELARKKAELRAKERAKKLAEEKQKAEAIKLKLAKEQEVAKKLKEERQTQLAALEKEKIENQKLILEEKKKREDLEKKLTALREQNKKNSSNRTMTKVKLPPEWEPFGSDMSLQQKQFCQLTNRFFEDISKAIKSKNEIKVNIVHKERQQNLDGLLPGGKVNNWIFKVVKIDQVEDGSAAVVLSLHCKSFVGSGQIHTKSTWRKKSSKEWRATIPYDDRRFRELAKLDSGQFILGSGTFLEINAFKPGQIETFYASQQIGEHPLTKDLKLKGELFLADLSYIAALN